MTPERREQLRRAGRRYYAMHRKGKTDPRSKEELRATSARYRKKNPLKVKAANTRWRLLNRAQNAARLAKWEIENRAKRRAIVMRRKAAKLRATPSWSDAAMIAAIYNACPEGHHVDHIVPLVSPVVCGLHVPANLQYLPRLENLAKGNRLVH